MQYTFIVPLAAVHDVLGVVHVILGEIPVAQIEAPLEYTSPVVVSYVPMQS